MFWVGLTVAVAGAFCGAQGTVVAPTQERWLIAAVICLSAGLGTAIAYF